MIMCFVVCFETSYFRESHGMGMGAFWQDCGDGSIFFLMIYFQKKSSYDSNDFFHIGMEAWEGQQLFVS